MRGEIEKERERIFTDVVGLCSLAYAELYLTVAAVFRRFDMKLYDTNYERDVRIPLSADVALLAGISASLTLIGYFAYVMSTLMSKLMSS